MVIDNNLNILWLSDIHFQSDYIIGSELPVIKGFLKYIEAYKDTNDIDYILISGDIANFGKELEYDLFKKSFLCPLQKLTPKAQLLIVPGNHDVNWKSISDSSISDDYIKSLSNEKSRFDFLMQNYNDKDKNIFKTFYSDYSNAFINDDLVSTKHCNKKINYNIPSDDNSDLVKNNLLYGYHIDHNKKTLFILLNSSWYSVGNQFINTYIKNLLKSKGTIKEDAEIKKIIKDIRTLANDYGGQLLGLNVYNLKKLIKLIKTYNDYITISVMHHPINWLNWDERLKLDEGYFYSTIGSKTDLLLTGHEHVPKKHKADYEHEKELLHIPAGCFFDEKKEGVIDLSRSWFSILKININKRTVLQEKHYYDIGEEKWLGGDVEETKKLNKKYTSILTKERKKNIKSKDFVFLNYLIEKYKEKEHSFKSMPNKNSIECYVLKEKLFILAKDLRSFKFGLSFDSIKRYINNYSITTVSLSFLDIDHDLFKDYSKKNDKLEVLENIKEDLDYKFDKFRYEFFSNLTDEEILKYKKLTFISGIMPYWVIETYLKS